MALIGFTELYRVLLEIPSTLYRYGSFVKRCTEFYLVFFSIYDISFHCKVMDLFIEWIELEQYQNEFYFVLRVQFDNRYIRNDELPNDVFNV